ncbi:hypothetical protein EB796_024673 [Bugula neritina]|uniref:Uncharacterized protein n=1 Tax=Bugula neritina TaxID=10212 RepID=A0A7J7IU27_BUGNE|nr:hypothetical protein EB796_024673 [Bugula neritina]
MTRAKSLLVLIGNPFVLCTDEKWRRMIAHIVQGGGYLGEELSEELLRIEPDEESKIRQAGVSNQQFMAEKERRGRSDYLLHHDDQWEHRDV